MIELNSKTQQDFLNREWIQKLLDAGVDMSDAKYYIIHTVEDEYDCGSDRDFIVYKEQVALYKSENPVPTYSTAELLYKLHEWIYSTPIKSLASLLIQCHKRDIGIKNKKGNQVSDTGNISDK